MPAAANSASQERNIRMRIAQRGDAEAIARLINAAFIVERVAFDGDRTDTQGVREYMEKGTFLVADDATELSGCVYVEIRGDRSYLGLLSVAPARQGTGLGRQLVAAAEEYARKAACRAMELRIISPRAESLLPFYQHLGYAQTGTAAFPAEVTTKMPCHYILMTKPLR
ncbi:MAG: GNAT family N-acetyltransferase [Candidatus Acidiferrum sp.]|jgi:GNAT superfamily N-acetyltransferase